MRLFIFMLFLSLKSFATEVAIIDTNFCKEKFKFLEVIDHSLEDQKLKSNCKSHGQRVLRFLDRFLTRKIKVHLFSVFNPRGQQSENLWKMALDIYKNLKVKYTLVAVGLPFKGEEVSLKKLFLANNSVKLVASGQVQKGITFKTKLFPQYLYENKKIVLVGEFKKLIRGNLFYPKMQLYKDNIEAFEETFDSNLLSGTSQAVTNLLIKKIKNL